MFYCAQIFTLGSDVVLNTHNCSASIPTSQNIWVEDVIEPEARPAVIQFKSEAKHSTLIGSKRKHAA